MPNDASVAILLATYNGAPFIAEQLRSLVDQSAGPIDLIISDDGSTDQTLEEIEQAVGEWPLLLSGPRQGFHENFRHLILHAPLDDQFYAFCDQDDVWQKDKLAMAIVALEALPADVPALYCSRTTTVSSDGTPIGQSPLFRKAPGFKNALVQSIAGGNTMVMNRAAFEIVRKSAERTSFVSHDWWCYMLVTGTGGRVIYSPASSIDYRQHAGNVVGTNSSIFAKLARIRRLFEGRFAGWNGRNVESLMRCRDLLREDVVRTIEMFEEARHSSLAKRLFALYRSGVFRQTFAGNLGLVVACAIGKL